MIFSQLAYGLVILTYFGDGTPMFYASPPTPHLNAGTLIELAEGLNERYAATKGYDYIAGPIPWGDWWFENVESIFYPELDPTPHELVEIPFAYTTVSTNDAGFTSASVRYGPTNGTWKAWTFGCPFLPGNPSYQGSRASSKLVRGVVRGINYLCDLSLYAQSYTDTNVVWWTTSALWAAVGGVPFEHNSDADLASDTYQPVTTSALWKVYRALTNLTTTAYIPFIMITNHVTVHATGTGYSPSYAGGSPYSSGIELTCEEVYIYDDGGTVAWDGYKTTRTGYIEIPNLSSGVVANVDAVLGIYISPISEKHSSVISLAQELTCTGVDTNHGPTVAWGTSAPDIASLVDMSEQGTNTEWQAHLIHERPVMIRWTFSRCHP